ncbi:MAG TPA: MscL family protein [Candidatus Saccharimonadales bacterium]|nr:MscL family protein [Candidatus Saccharimonadales bacterium]
MAEAKKSTNKSKPTSTETAAKRASTAKARERAAALRERVNKVPVAGSVNKQLGGFVGFLREQAVVGLAIGIVIGSQVQTIAKALVADFINPVVALVMPGAGDLANKVFYIHRPDAPAQKFMWGDFVSNVISFVILVAVIYFVIKGFRLDKLDKKKES